MTEQKPENPQDSFDDFFNMVKEGTIQKAQDMEMKIATAFVDIEKDKQLLTLALALPSPSAWKPLVARIVKENDADAYALVAEMWLTRNPAYNGRNPQCQPKDDPNNRSAVFILCYHRDGRKKTHAFYITNDRKIVTDEAPLITEGIEKFLMGNVFPQPEPRGVVV